MGFPTARNNSASLSHSWVSGLSVRFNRPDQVSRKCIFRWQRHVSQCLQRAAQLYMVHIHVCRRYQNYLSRTCRPLEVINVPGNQRGSCLQRLAASPPASGQGVCTTYTWSKTRLVQDEKAFLPMPREMEIDDPPIYMAYWGQESCYGARVPWYDPEIWWTP